ncbi:MAG: LacI family DNA-binding transcriptional regulator [Desulfuromonadales bacterium]|nr:LacI family DNA-binding transcriptional regulator [Desulfuromonadales bacterium]
MSTIKDVARLAMVSTATVSRVINTPEAVRSQTCDKVRGAMEMCGYKYNALARSFATNQSRTLGVIIPSITNPIFAESTRGIQDTAEQHGYHVVLGNTDYNGSKELRLVEVFRELQVNGLLITTASLKHDWLQQLARDNFPFLLLHSTVRNGPLSCVGVDNYKGGYMATRHLIESGHRRIGMVAGTFSASDKSFHRWHGFRKCLQDHNLPYDADLVRQYEYSLENGRTGIIDLMKSEKSPTAVFCSNDYLALGAMKGARELGLDVPADLSIVGFDDMPMAAFFNPGLDTVRQPAYEMGRIGTELLLEAIATPEILPVQKLLPLELVRRGSVQPPKS